jgi:DNA-binding MarR family transcriptional regulator
LSASDNKYDHQILQAIASGAPVTQRALSGKLGVALGLTNLLVRRLVGKGYIKMAGMGTRHVRYLMTPAGWEALSQATRISLENTIHLYTETREQIRGSLIVVSERCQAGDDGRKRVVFYGAGDVAEIAYISLHNTDLMLVGVVDDRRRGNFFGVTISGPECLTPDALDGVPYSHVIVTSVRHAEAIQARISERGVPSHRVCCL